ncbi:TonB-dependent receptor [Carboxylicivirga sp. A043]|uniref:TonB-dependent receptor n=1 Tax=Carboxylicivirga litoralis TaxID=2816963 RepID=UPI0021CB053E|nr:TonB-dependent receptor [Carboxylicivirga sp. A043]MCU4157833.1 TonB-dependent receptor [Carboxylicivirga sp. A043]
MKRKTNHPDCLHNYRRKKIYRIMKLLSVFLFCGSMVISAAGYAQNKRVTIQESTISIQELFEQIENSADCRFAYSNSQLNPRQIVSVNVKDSDVEEVLKQVLDKNLTYKVIENYYVIVDKTQSDVVAQVQQHVVEGKVTDHMGEPLPGVNVYEQENPTSGVITGIDGSFSISVSSENASLTFSFVGFESQVVNVAGRTNFNITMVEEATGLDEVVVVAYGTQKKVNVTGSVSAVTSDKIEERPVQNVSQALQGIVPGLNVTSSGGGELNNPLKINIRGAGTIGDGSNSGPLILIDGMEGDMNSLNPQDIESISVLKDAASSAIYGSRAPFGVILITTKRGKEGRMQINYNNNFRWSDPLLKPNMLDSYTFAKYWNDARANAGQNPAFSDEVLERILAYQKGEIDYGTVANTNGDRWQQYTGSHANTDWFEEHYKSWTPSQEHALSLNGGSEKIQYYLSTNYLNQNGLLRHANDSFDRFTVTANVTAQLADFASIRYNTKFIRETYEKATHQFGLFYHNIARRWPTNPVYDPNGFYADGGEILQLREGGRNISEKDQNYQQFRLDIEPIKGWKLIGELNYRTDTYFSSSNYLPAYAHDVAGNPYAVGVGWLSPGSTQASEYASKTTYMSPNLYTQFTKEFEGGHNLTALAGFQSEENKTRNLGGYRNDLISPDLPTINTASGEDKITSGGYGHWATAGFFGRINYNYQEKYLVELNARYDGTSRFLREERWNLFPSLSVGWNIARENFWQPLEDKINTLKLRASWGELGNQNTKQWYPFYTTMPVGTANGSWMINGMRPNTASSPGLVSSLLTWETVRSWNIGLDAGMFDNRLTLVFDYFQRFTEDMVGPAPELPATLGTSVPKINNADMKSYGFELELSWRDKIGQVSYGVRGILADDQQEVTRYPNENGRVDMWYAGRMGGEIWGYTTHGIAKSDDEMNNWLANHDQSVMGSNWAAGDIMYEDLNNDGEINSGSGVLGDTGDYSIIGNNTPRYKFSIDLDAAWKGIDFRMLWQGVGKRDYALGGPYFWGANGNMWQAAGFKEHMDYFRPEGHELGANVDGYYPRPIMSWESNKNTKTQTRYLQNAAYIRLKNIQVGYTIPQTFTKKYGVQKLRFYVSGENLLTFTEMTKIFDPETIDGGWSDGKIYPLSKTISAGCSITF